jgi:hypothetical protein
MTMTARQPRMIPNPLYCERCDKYGYRVIDAEWEPYAVQCPSGFSPLECDGRRPRPAHRRAAGIPRLFVLTPRALCPSLGLSQEQAGASSTASPKPQPPYLFLSLCGLDPQPLDLTVTS